MNQTLTEHHIAQYNILLIEDQIVNQTVNYTRLYQLYLFLMIYYIQIQFIPHMVYNKRMHPQLLNIALQNWTQQLTKHHYTNEPNVNWAPHCTMYNQTKHAWQLGNIAIVFVSHVFCKDKFDLFLTWKTIQNCSLKNWTSHLQNWTKQLTEDDSQLTK